MFIGIRKEIKSIMALEGKTIARLAKIANENGYQISAQSISEKLSRETIKHE